MEQKAGLFLLRIGVCCERARAPEGIHTREEASGCKLEWWTTAVNETVYQINMAIISQMTLASTEERS